MTRFLQYFLIHIPDYVFETTDITYVVFCIIILIYLLILNPVADVDKYPLISTNFSATDDWKRQDEMKYELIIVVSFECLFQLPLL